ncbi:MAG: sensor histidine kinase [Microcella pacifica]|uniref:sensor histidine kinase n=1 Tax=Microcella pacifica TaxID=2591847 RepID=UPI000C38C63D|nr:histidine kinase [Leifsonia sp.]
MTAQTRTPSTVDADGNWVRPRPGVAGMHTDGLLALGIAVGASLAILLYASAEFFDEPPVPWMAALVVLGISGPLVWRRVAPITVTIVISIVYVCAIYNQVPEVLFSNIALFMAMYSIGAWSSSRRHALIARIVVVVGMFGWLFWELTRATFDTSLAPEGSGIGLIAPGVALGLISVITNVLYFAGAWAFGERAWTAARERAELEARTHELEAERELTAAQAVELDRVRIARELHDVVAHHVSVMGIQAGAARRVLGPDAPSGAVTALGSVESSAREAVDELHRLVTTLRGIGGEGDASDGPSTRGTAQLAALVDDVLAAGRTASYSIIGERQALSPIVDTTLYRVGQEAITNSLKHAGASATMDVRLRFSTEQVELEVADSGHGTRAAQKAGRSGGLGQIGMRERLAAVGGSLEAGPRRRGGYLVRATVPLLVGERAADSGEEASS